jgi:hypothetical protein
MTVVRITLPEDFDERYKKYRARNDGTKMPEPFLIDRLENERKHILLIKSKEDFQDELNKWHPLKIIVDAVYKELSPFLPGSAQIIKIDLTKLGLVKEVAGHIFLMLAYERVCRWKVDNNPVVITTKAIREYMEGDGIVVPDYEKFQELRNKINDFYTFVTDQHRQKFPTDFPDAKSNALENKIQESGGANNEEIDMSVKRVGVYGGEVVSDLPLIDYNETTGKGEVIGKKKFKFKDGSSEYNVFKMLYAKLGKKPAKLERLDVLVAGGFYPDHQQELDPVRKTAETACINEIAKNIREKTGLNTDELVNNNGSLTLLALRQDKNPPKVTKFVPVWG